MKKCLAAALSAFLLIGCDDGDLQVDTINFDDVETIKCPDNGIIFKLNGNQVLLLELNTNPFDNNPGVKDLIDIGTENQVRYRLYSGLASNENICSNIQPATPVIIEEWTATSGKVAITTSQVLSNPDPITGATTINSYNHSIVFRDIVFEKPSGNQVYESFSFGDYTTPATQLSFNFDLLDVAICPSTNIIYNAEQFGREALFIVNIDPTLLATDGPNLNVPKTSPISETTNKLIYRSLRSQFPSESLENYFCSGTANSPETDQEWTGSGGEIEITTTVEGAGFRHVIRLKNVTFNKGNSSFFYGYNILYGELLQ